MGGEEGLEQSIDLPAGCGQFVGRQFQGARAGRFIIVALCHSQFNSA